ncbi:MAG: hypothetical protein ACKOC0_10400 [Cytophagales bacterium]
MRDIVLECNPDEALVRTLGYSKREITHQPNKGQVFNYLEKNHQACGIVDEDPGSANPGYFSHYIKQGETKFDVDFFLNIGTGAKLIVLKPRLEDWVLKQAKQEGVEPDEFSLPPNGRQLHRIVNQRIPKFEQMLHQMKGCAALNYLKHLLK